MLRYILSVITLWGRFVHQLVNANLVAATTCIKPNQDVRLFFRPNVRMGKKCDLWPWNDCWCQTGWIEYLRNCWSHRIFTHSSLQSLQRIGVKNKKTSSEQQFCKHKCIFNKRRTSRLVKPDRKVTVMRKNHALQQCYAEQHLWIGYSSRRLSKYNKYLIKCSLSVQYV